MGEGEEPIEDDEYLYRRIVLKYFNPGEGQEPSPWAFRPRDYDQTGISIFRAKYVRPELDFCHIWRELRPSAGAIQRQMPGQPDVFSGGPFWGDSVRVVLAQKRCRTVAMAPENCGSALGCQAGGSAHESDGPGRP